MLITAKTPDGRVVRDVFSHGERAWRLNRDGSVCKSTGHKGPWIVCRWTDVPRAVQVALQPDCPPNLDALRYALVRTYLLFREAADQCPVGPLASACANLAEAMRSYGYLPSEAESVVTDAESQGA